jgi:hypothetical protein
MYQQCNHETEQDHVADVLTPEQKIVAIDKAIATIKKELDAMNPGDEGYENKTKELTTLEDQKKALTPPDEKPINEVSPEQQDANEKKAILSTVRLSDGKEK